MDREIIVIDFFTWKGHECFYDIIIDQKHCVCCWALVSAALVSFEIKRGDPRNPSMKTWNASPQELVDMFPRRYPLETGELSLVGCYFGSPVKGLEYVKEYGITLDSVYKFKAYRQWNKEPPQLPRIKIQDITKFDDNGVNEEEIFRILRERPIAGKIYVSDAFINWKGPGIFSERSVPNPLVKGWHAVLIIGGGVDSLGRRFYHIKNTWGKKWGEKGYAKVLCDLVIPICYLEGAYFVER